MIFKDFGFSVGKLNRAGHFYCLWLSSAKPSRSNTLSSGKAIRVDVASLIDDRPISALQLRVFVFCALVAVLDGVDSQAIAVAGPLIRTQLGISAVTFSLAFSAGPFGDAPCATLICSVTDP